MNAKKGWWIFSRRGMTLQWTSRRMLWLTTLPVRFFCFYWRTGILRPYCRCMTTIVVHSAVRYRVISIQCEYQQKRALLLIKHSKGSSLHGLIKYLCYTHCTRRLFNKISSHPSNWFIPFYAVYAWGSISEEWMARVYRIQFEVKWCTWKNEHKGKKPLRNVIITLPLPPPFASVVCAYGFASYTTGKEYQLNPLGDAGPVINAGGLFPYAIQTGMITKLE